LTNIIRRHNKSVYHQQKNEIHNTDMSVKDRTVEFRSAVESMRSRTLAHENRRLLAGDQQQLMQQRANNKTEFTRMASAIGRDINSTAAKLQKLTKLAKRKTLFDDRPVEISELTYIIKQDIAKLNKQIAMLQQHVRDQKSRGALAGSKQADEHSSNVVVLLQSKLASTSMSFKDVLEIRTQNMKASKDRREQFMNTPSGQQTSAASDSPLYNVQRKDDSSNRDFLALDMSSGGQMQQLHLMEQQDTYIETRASAIESIESTISELGNIFQQLATMVAEQRETVQRIDHNTEEIHTSVTGAQQELLKYYASISSNRWLIMKVLAIVIFFFLVFVVVT